MAAADYRPDPKTPALGAGFFAVVQPALFPTLTLRFANRRAAATVGLAALSDAAWLDHFARFVPLPENLAAPLALGYHGYQFRTYNPRLGDGRGFLFAQLRDDRGRLVDLGTKGSGQTPWSRDGDGRLTLKGGVREILATEMLEALGVETSKTFSLVETGEALSRGDEPSPTRASVLVRLSHSHVRFGTFERLAYHEDRVQLQRLLDFVLANYFPTLRGGPTALFAEICQRTARLCASYMAAGFVHGVLNTDNMNVTGESFDYGPWRFLPHYDPLFTAAYFDHTQLYAYGRQLETMRWNLERLADAFSLLVPRLSLLPALVDFEGRYLTALSEHVLARLGIARRDVSSDAILVARLFCFLKASRLPFDRVFFDWFGGEVSTARAAKSRFAAAYAREEFAAVRAAWAGRAPTKPNALQHAYFSGETPTTMHIDEVERVWEAIATRDDWQPLHDKIAAVRSLGEIYV